MSAQYDNQWSGVKWMEELFFFFTLSQRGEKCSALGISLNCTSRETSLLFRRLWLWKNSCKSRRHVDSDAESLFPDFGVQGQQVNGLNGQKEERSRGWGGGEG